MFMILGTSLENSWKLLLVVFCSDSQKTSRYLGRHQPWRHTGSIFWIKLMMLANNGFMTIPSEFQEYIHQVKPSALAQTFPWNSVHYPGKINRTTITIDMVYCFRFVVIFRFRVQLPRGHINTGEVASTRKYTLDPNLASELDQPRRFC